MEDKKFTPIKLHFDKLAYKRACKEADEKFQRHQYFASNS